MKLRNTLVLAASVLALCLGGCGAKKDLAPLAGASLPPAPYGAANPRSSAELLKTSPMAVPERSVELRSESEEREDDPFDLPPEG